jgi:aryl-alcohol dehydrogenase-like predicted oxidoreductase
VGHTRPAPHVWKPLGRPEYLKQAAELSLRRLKAERLDLLHLHRIDPTVPYADQLGALAEMQAEGKVRHLGLSEVTVEQLEEAQRVIEVVSVQNRYNLTDREHDPVLDYCSGQGIAFVPWLPIRERRACGVGVAGRGCGRSIRNTYAGIPCVVAASIAGGRADSRNEVRGASGGKCGGRADPALR